MDETEKNQVVIPEQVKNFKLSDYLENIMLIHEDDVIDSKVEGIYRHEYKIPKNTVIGLIALDFSCEDFKVQLPIVRLGGIPMSDKVRLNLFNAETGKCKDDTIMIVDYKKEVESSITLKRKKNIKHKINNVE